MDMPAAYLLSFSACKPSLAPTKHSQKVSSTWSSTAQTYCPFPGHVNGQHKLSLHVLILLDGLPSSLLADDFTSNGVVSLAAVLSMLWTKPWYRHAQQV